MKKIWMILWSYIVGIRCEDLSTRDYVYVSTPMTFNAAEAYCLSTYEKHLATIITEYDMMDAVSTINGSNAVWIGLHSVHEIGWFEYFDDVKCPADTVLYGACLKKDFWVDGKPKKCDVGSECVTVYTHYDDAKMNNDAKCETLQPFLCDAPNPIRQYIDTKITGTWVEAYDYCLLNHDGLASFVTQDDLSNLEQVIDETGSDFAWIGLVQRENDQDWYWLDDTECTVTNDLCTDLWSPGEPNGSPGHAWCECKSYGCLQTGCVSYYNCGKRCVRRDCSSEGHLSGQHRCECYEWRYECDCRQQGCIKSGCIDYQCYTEDADCAGVQSSSGLTADYHCTKYTAPIICNDQSIMNSAKTVSNNYLLSDRIEPEHFTKNTIWRLLGNHNFNKYLVFILAISCMLNIVFCFGYIFWCRHQRSKIKYESVDMEETKSVDIDK